MTDKLGLEWEEIQNLAYWHDQMVDEDTVNVLADFKNFLYIVAMQEFGIPPTKIQYDIADYLQFGPSQSIIEAFRGVGKSYVTIAFAAWNLFRYGPTINILVVSATKDFATQFTTGLKRTMASLDFMNGFLPDDSCRDSVKNFDVPGNIMVGS